jgi:uncharacterized protein (DUF362 family)
LPGAIYGWPKNVLHYAGIPKTVIDICASVPWRIAMVDGIVCMEGDGPILGTAKPMGLVAVWLNLQAVAKPFSIIDVPYLQEMRILPVGDV